jgi:hypothetical protein
MMVPLSHFATYLSNIYFYIILFYFEDSILIYSQILFYPILYLFSEFFYFFLIFLIFGHGFIYLF